MRLDLYENETTPEGVDPGGTGDRPDYLLEKFKSPEDQARAYAEAEKEMARLRSQGEEERAQFAAALERIEAATPAPQQQFQAQPGVDPEIAAQLSAYSNAMEAGDTQTAFVIQLALNQRLTQQTVSSALDERFKELKPALDTQSQADRNIAFELGQERVAKQFGEEWNDIQPEVQAWLNEHQAWLPTVNDPAAFEKVVREGAEIVVNAKKAQALAAFEADRQAKLGAQTAAGSGSGRHSTLGDGKKEAWDEIAGATTGSYGQMRGGN